MSFLHIAYAGDFERDGEWVRFAGTPDDPILKPVIRRPLDEVIVNGLAGKEEGRAGGNFPEAWHIWAEDGYLAFDRYKLTPDAVAFLTRLVAATGCQLVDFNSRSEVGVDDLASDHRK
jgi:hypothetical protein